MIDSAQSKKSQISILESSFPIHSKGRMFFNYWAQFAPAGAVNLSHQMPIFSLETFFIFSPRFVYAVRKPSYRKRSYSPFYVLWYRVWARNLHINQSLTRRPFFENQKKNEALLTQCKCAVSVYDPTNRYLPKLTSKNKRGKSSGLFSKPFSSGDK